MSKKIHNKRKRQMASDSKEADEDDDENDEHNLQRQKKIKFPLIKPKSYSQEEGGIVQEDTTHTESENANIDLASIEQKDECRDTYHDEESCEKLQNIYSELYDDHDVNKPFDLSIKSKCTNRESDISAPVSHHKTDDDTNSSEDETVKERTNPEFNATSLENSSVTQELIMEHLSKIQQHFVVNLLQYQASFMAHYQQIQQQMLTKGEVDTECDDEEKSVNNDEKFEDGDSDEDGTESTHENSPEFHVGQNLISSSNILRNLVPFALYPRLFQFLSNVNASNPFSNITTATDLSQAYSQHNETKEENASEMTTLKDHLRKQSSDTAQLLTYSSSDDKYSILGSFIGASKEKILASNFIDNELSEELGTESSSTLQNKRKRIAFSAKQYELLQTTFEHNNFPEPADQQCIARQLKAPYRSIKMWFQNKRANARKKLLPGEKGSGKTQTGEKIPGDTDTRFYCDKCPSAFICQTFLNNHLHAHTLYTKSCHKCRVTFTHDCLLTTHIISKCGKKEDKKTDEFKENDDGVLDLKFLTKLKSSNIEENVECYTHLNGKDYSSIPSAILSQLKSTLPLLTLLQIQKKQEEQKRDELIVQMETNAEDPSRHLAIRDQNYSDSSNEAKLEIDECNDSVPNIKAESKVIPKDLPPLIPSEFVTSDIGTSSNFAILRQLLTNNACNIKKQESELKESSNNTKKIVFNTEEEKNTQNLKVPRNIPEHLYQLLDIKIDLSQPAKSNEYDQKDGESEEYESMETDIEINVIKEEKMTVEKRKNEIDEDDTSPETKFIRGPKAKRLRRRTTVFTENQHRILYLHFTHCNFPDPAMFRILSKLTGLTPHVIKIWFQNERSRQRRQVSASEEVIKEKKPYKCRDCGVEFAMPAFLVKHCMRHIPTDNVTSQARKCPICMVEFETQKLHSHFMASHNLSVTMEDEGATEKNICHLCQEQFPDLSSLSLHKNEHLKDSHYGDPPQCYECKTTFVNVLCLEAHMATHDKFMWEHHCLKCKMKFYDKILLESHLMTHSINNNNTTPVDYSIESSMNHSKYLVSLAQKFTSDSKLKPILPKDEYENSINIQLNPKSKECMKSPCHEDSNKLIMDSKSSKPSNVSFKLIPVKFIPVNSSQSSTVSNAQVTVVSSPMLTIRNDKNYKSDEPIKENGKYIISNLSRKDTIVNCLSKSKEDMLEKSDKSLKKVPNLIPISETFSLKPFEFINGTVISPIKTDKDCEEAADNQDKKTDYSSASSVSSDLDETNDPSQVLLYTPYASEYRKRRRTPTHFNSSQRDILEAYYKYDNFPDPNEQLHLSEYLQVPYSVIKTWFQNTRKNHRKHLKVSSASEVGGPFECSVCRVCFVSKIYIDSHVKQHQDKQPYECTICNLRFPHIAVYDIHVKMGCSKKIKKKHDHIRQFSSTAVTNNVPQPELNCAMNEKSETFDKKINLPLRLTRDTFQPSSKNNSNIKFVSLEYSELNKTSIILKTCDMIKDIENQNLHLLSDVTAQYEDELINSSAPLCKENISKLQFHTCVQCSQKFSSLNLLTSHNKKGHNGACETGIYVPQIVGYTCPQCNQTFPSFLEIAEHKENSVCLHHKHDKIKVQAQSTFKKVQLTYSKHFDLYEVSCLKSLPLSMVLPKITVDLSNGSNSSNKDLNKKLSKLKCANLNFLKLHYKYNNFPSSKDISLMSKKLCIDMERVAYWFQKRRTRERKGNTIASTVLCQSCSSAFVHQDALQEHQLSVHNPSAICIQFICPVENCKMKYPNSTLLQTHQMSHEENKEIKKTALKYHGGFLEAHYLENNFPTPMDVGFIARRLNVESLSIHWWFKIYFFTYIRQQILDVI